MYNHTQIRILSVYIGLTGGLKTRLPYLPQNIEIFKHAKTQQANHVFIVIH